VRIVHAAVVNRRNLKTIAFKFASPYFISIPLVGMLVSLGIPPRSHTSLCGKLLHYHSTPYPEAVGIFLLQFSYKSWIPAALKEVKETTKDKLQYLGTHPSTEQEKAKHTVACIYWVT
jgi:hypothetical protein